MKTMMLVLALGPIPAKRGASRAKSSRNFKRRRFAPARRLPSSPRGIYREVQSLSAAELAELQGLMASEIAAADTDVQALRTQVEQEAALVKSTRTMDVRLSRSASQILQAEMMRRIERGYCPAPAALVGEAVAEAFAGACS